MHLAPTLRPGLGLAQDDTGRVFLLDTHRVTGPPVLVSALDIQALKSFTGKLTLAEIASEKNVPIARLEELVGLLDESCFLDNDAFRNYVTGPIRMPSCIGVYPPDAQGICETVEGLFTAEGGAGTEKKPLLSNTPLRAILLPHMDYTRGNITFGHGFRALLDHTTADTFVVLATSHYSAEPFSLSFQHYQTPLGLVEVDLEYAELIADYYGDELFEDPFAHFPEHSIELELIPLQVLRPHRPFRIVPILVGPMDTRQQPGPGSPQHKMIEVLKRVETELKRNVVYIISGDLAHIGPKFEDADLVTPQTVAYHKQRDSQLLDCFPQAKACEYFEQIANEHNRRRICGFAPTYVALSAANPSHGHVLHYQQYVCPQGNEMVSFASAAFFA